MSETKIETSEVVTKEPAVEVGKVAAATDLSSEKYIAVVQVRGLVGVKATVKDTLRMLGLTRANQCVLIENKPSIKGMLLKVKDYTTFGPVKMDLVNKLVAKRGIEYEGRLQDSKSKYTYSNFELNGKKYKKCFKLNPPRKGFGRAGIKRSFASGGALGDRGAKIADIIERMI